MNFARDVAERAPGAQRALVELTREGARREWSFGEVAQRSAALSGALVAAGVGRGDVVLTLIGNRSEWVLTMVACFRIGAVVLPCTEQLRAKDLRLRLDAVTPRMGVADERNRATLEQALALSAGVDAPAPEVLLVPDPGLFAASGPAVPAVDLAPTDGSLTPSPSGPSGTAKPVLHGQRYLTGQRLQAEHWLAA